MGTGQEARPQPHTLWGCPHHGHRLGTTRGRRGLALSPGGTRSLEPGACPRTQSAPGSSAGPSSLRAFTVIPPGAAPALLRREEESTGAPAPRSQQCTSRATGFPLRPVRTEPRPPSLFHKAHPCTSWVEPSAPLLAGLRNRRVQRSTAN